MPTIVDSFGVLTVPAELAKLYLKGLSQGLDITASLVSRRGQTQLTEGNSNQLTWEEDRLLLSALRSNAELVLTTGKTARDEKLKNPKTAKLAILTKSKNMLGTEFERPDEVILISEANCPSEALMQLREIGYCRVNAELGPTTMQQALREGSIELLFLSEFDQSTEIDTSDYSEIFSIGLGPGQLRGLINGVAI